MPTRVDREEVQRLVLAGAQLVVVLPGDEYDAEHMPGAVHLPLKTMTRESAAAVLDAGRGVVVYCWDAL
jgi:rhodanese-related sulfurtransferase